MLLKLLHWYYFGTEFNIYVSAFNLDPENDNGEKLMSGIQASMVKTSILQKIYVSGPLHFQMLLLYSQ